MKKFLFIFLLPIFTVAQDQPKVGVVLSGGGAKGIAHIAILKELEKSGVQIDYIGGTSMGAIIGGLYAAGYSAEQIEHLFLEVDFTTLIQDKVPREAKPFFEKNNGEKYAISLPVRKNSIGLPKGVSKGQNVLNFLTELLSPVDSISDFSKLPIPFYCIATDVETGEKAVLDKGSLPLSLRASGSFPTLLHPVEIDGKLLIDGGIANNFPVDEMKKRGADIVIGVDVQNELADKEKLTSVVAILNQITAYQMYNTTEKQKEQVDVYIHPEIVGYNVVSFDKAREIFKKGEEIAKKLKPVFESIAEQQIKKKSPRRKMHLKGRKFLVDRIIIRGNKNYTDDYVLGSLQLKEQDSISYREMSEKINRLTATKNFDRIDYNFNESFNCKNLFIKLKENETRSFLRLGLHYDLLYKSGVLINYTYKRLLAHNDIFSLDVVVGDNIRYDLNYFIDNGFHWGFGIHSGYNSFSSSFNFNGSGFKVNKVNVDYKDFKNGLYVETKFDKKFAFGFGLNLRTIKAFTETVFTNNRPIFIDNSNYLIANSFLKLDMFDKPYYPTSGVYTNAEFNWYLWSDRNTKRLRFFNYNEFSQFSQIKATFSTAKTFFNKLTLQLTFDGGYTLGEEGTEIFDFRLGNYNKNFTGNFVRFYGYDLAGLTNQAFVKGELDFRYQFIPKNYASFIANYARVSNKSILEGDVLKDIKTGYAIGYGLETFLGPIELKYAWSPENNRNFWFFNLGFWF